MGKTTKFAPWVNLAIGLIWLLIPIRNTWMPGFLSITGTRHSADFIWFNLAIGVIYLFLACRGFMRMRRPSAI